MRIAALLAVLAGCGFTVGGASGGDGGGDDEPGTHTLVDDSAEDFGHFASFTDGVVAARGALEPDGFVTGGLHAVAYRGHTMAANQTWEQILATLPATPIGEAYSIIPKDYGGDRPRGLNIGPTNDDFTLVLDGEALLPAGLIDIEVAADDHAVVQFSFDGGTTWTPIVYDDAGPGEGHAQITVPAAGWYPVRGAMDDNFGGARFDITIKPGAGIPIHLDGNSLRSRVTKAHGLLVHAFDSIVFNPDVGESFSRTLDGNWGLKSPEFDLGLGVDNFVLRYTGQIYIATEDNYAFSLNVADDDLWRIFVDDKLAGSNLMNQSGVAPSTLHLTPGWHDFVADYFEVMTNASVQLRVVGGQLNGPVATELLRPVAVTNMTVSFLDNGSKNINDAAGTINGITEYTFGPGTAPANSIIDIVDWSFDIEGHNSNVFDDLSAAFVCPMTGVMTTQNPFATNGTAQNTGDVNCAGAPMTGTWTLKVTDNVMNGMPGMVRQGFVIAHYHGGEFRRPFATTTEYISSPKSTPGAKSYGAVQLVADKRGAIVDLNVRTGDDEASLDAAAWVPVADGDVPSVPAGELIQYKITITQDGWQNASVDRVALKYSTR